MHLLIFIVVCLLPTVLYYGYGIFVAKFLEGQAQMSFHPHLLFQREYWKGWLIIGSNAVGHTPLVAALLGIPMLRMGFPRTLMIGLWIGYAVFCMVFTYHVRFAGYYHLQLIIIVALSFGPIVTLVANHLRQACTRWYGWTLVAGAILMVMLLNLREVRYRQAAARDFESQEVARDIGEIVKHSTQTTYLASYYGTPLEYYGELSGKSWPRRASHWTLRRPGEEERTIEERFDALGFSPEYFIITDFNEFDRHHKDLKQFLSDNWLLVAESEKYLIYKNLRK